MYNIYIYKHTQTYIYIYIFVHIYIYLPFKVVNQGYVEYVNYKY